MSPAIAREGSARLRAIHLATSDVGTRLTLDISRVTGEKLFTLEHPFRAVIDLPQTRPKPGLELPEARGLIAGIRMAPRAHGALRLVVVLHAASGVHADWAYSRDAWSSTHPDSRQCIGDRHHRRDI